MATDQGYRSCYGDPTVGPRAGECVVESRAELEALRLLELRQASRARVMCREDAASRAMVREGSLTGGAGAVSRGSRNGE